VRLVVGILFRSGAAAGTNRYQARYDLDHDLVIGPGDLQLALLLRTCHHEHHHHWF
jgi:hypothetical protein